MSNNPYSSPGQARGPSGVRMAKSQISGPAISLLVVTSISLILVLVGLGFDIFLIASGAVDQMAQPELVAKRTQIMIRIIWSIFLLLSNIVILVAAIKMLSLRNYGFSKAGAILSVIPCLGPCCILGIPFGIWALVVMGKPEIKNAFR